MKKSHFLIFVSVIALAASIIVVPLVADSLSGNTPNLTAPPETPEKPSDPEIPDAADYIDRDVSGRNIAYVTMTIKDYGDVKLLLDATSAPVTVAHFLDHVKSGFYDGLDFFSINALSETEAVIFSGDPTANGGVASPDIIASEAYITGNKEALSLKRGTITMSISDNSGNAGTAFFFNNSDLSDIGAYYTTFGYVIHGYKVVDKIIEDGLRFANSYGSIPLANRPVISSITIDQDIDYSLITNVYLASPTADEIADLLGAGNEAKRSPASLVYASVRRAYTVGESRLLQITGKIDDALANLLISTDKSGTITGVKALNFTDSGIIPLLSSLVGLNRSTVETAELPAKLKSMASDAIHAALSLSASEYSYSRDTEGRETYTVEMKVQDYDTPVVILLDKTTAPITVDNFLSLVKKGFYDGLYFHRIIKGFMIQGGDGSHLPETEQAKPIKGEFKSNGHDNDILHKRGTISMARADDPNSASSGFFICDANSSHLDGNYAAFGYVLSGMETVDAIAAYYVGKTDSNGNIYYYYFELPTIEYIKIIEN